MNKTGRILIVDTLRGFALLLIVLIHYVEHFDFFMNPEINFLFSQETDNRVMEWIFIIISGKAYSIFALLFGFSFFIQMDRKKNEGVNFMGRFIWRLTILLLMGFIHSLIYRGDILHIYALLAIPLLFIYRVNTKILLCISVLLVLQIPMIYHLIRSFSVPEYEYANKIPQYWAEGNNVYATGNFVDVVKYNFWKGRISVWAWTIYNGRYLQLITLFIVGMILGRTRVFEKISDYKRSLFKVLVISIVLFFVFYYSGKFFTDSSYTRLQLSLISTILTSYSNLAITSVITTLIILIYLKFQNAYIFRLFAAYGKMSLSNYIFQAVLGVIIFYGYGFALYKYLGSTWSLILGLMIFTLQAVFSDYWNKKFYYGPLEWVWRALTYMDFGIRFRKPSV
ncbi:MAG: DUF418 domain-containing protein [Bacteroidales bacterium]|nr:DUF418 domain-containing protein [Bacteroidales bacterium]